MAAHAPPRTRHLTEKGYIRDTAIPFSLISDLMARLSRGEGCLDAATLLHDLARAFKRDTVHVTSLGVVRNHPSLSITDLQKTSEQLARGAGLDAGLTVLNDLHEALADVVDVSFTQGFYRKRGGSDPLWRMARILANAE